MRLIQCQSARVPECACHRLALADSGKSLYNYVYCMYIAVLVVCTAIAVSVAKAPHMYLKVVAMDG